MQSRAILVSLEGDRLVRSRAADVGGEERRRGDQRRWAEVVIVLVLELERCLYLLASACLPSLGRHLR